MGAANVIPGVSGGTIALITGIFEKLIHSIKSFDLEALKLLTKFRLKAFANHVNLSFLIVLGLGIVASIVTLARLLEFLFENYPVYVWAYFFGLILASVYFVGKTIEKWRLIVILSFIIGTGIAISLSFMNAGTENESFIYLMLCGIAAICSMILPGLSGSFVLILMGNYELVVIKAVNNLRVDILLPVILGAAIGLVAFSHLLSWLYNKYKDQTIALLTGFILGSLLILWPWQNTIFKYDAYGELATKASGEPIILSYEPYMPDALNNEVLFAVLYAVAGIVSIWLIEKLAIRKPG